MGYCEDCSKCGRVYDTKYFLEFCPYCYTGIDKLQAQNKKLIEALEACYNIDAKYIDQTTSVTYKEYYCDIMDILEKTLAEIKEEK